MPSPYHETRAPTFGIGDIVFSLFLSPSKPSHWIWGLGPVFGLPMSTDPTIGSGKWQVGPTGVGLYLNGPWLAGVLVNQLWSFASTGDVNRESVSHAGPSSASSAIFGR